MTKDQLLNTLHEQRMKLLTRIQEAQTDLILLQTQHKDLCADIRRVELAGEPIEEVDVLLDPEHLTLKEDRYQ